MTLAHPAAVLPLRRFGLPMTALVAGSMVPDVPLFLGSARGYAATHSLLGILVIDVLLAVGVVLLWTGFARDAVVDMAPAPIRRRLPARARLSSAEWLMVPVAGAVGAATHVLWDSFTHPGRWGPRHIEWLRIEHGALPGLKWVQYASGVVGLVVVVWAVVGYFRSLQPRSDERGPALLPPATLPAVIVASGAIGLASAAVNARHGLHAMAFEGVVNSLITVAALGALTCAVWHVVRRAGSRDAVRWRRQPFD
jgi:hypothetical protein